MAVLDTIYISEKQIREAGPGADLVALVKSIIAKEFWRWYVVHQDDKIKTIKIWFITKTVRVRDLEPFFEMLFGPSPAGSTVR